MELNKTTMRLIAARHPFSVVEIKNDPRITNVNGKQSSYNIVRGNGSGIAEFGCDELSATWFCEAANRYAAEIYRGKYPTNEQETPADIIAEKRREADELEASSYKPHQFLRERIAELRREADRLEAAWKREKAAIEADALAVGGIVEASRKRERGDCAKLREALEFCVKGMCGFCRMDAEARGMTTECVNGCEALRKAKAALAAQPRNCDLPEVVKDPWRAWLDDKSNWEEGYPKLEIHDWLLAPATEKEGGAK